jgi:hypothetical protein
MSDERPEYERRATEYEERAKRVTDPWTREKYLTLAEHCRDMKRVPARQEAHSQNSGIVSRKRGGVALRNLGSRESGTQRLEEAVAAFRAALTEQTRERVPLKWASTQTSLAVAFRVLGERESGTQRLEEAVAAYRAALTEQTRERVPFDWAGTQDSLGIALGSPWGARERHAEAGRGGGGLSCGTSGANARARAVLLGDYSEQSGRCASTPWRARERNIEA